MKLFIAGHGGLVGSSVLRYLNSTANFIIPQQFGRLEVITRTRTELDLTRQEAVEDFFATEKPDMVLLAAAKVGGIISNSLYGGDFIRDNLLIQTNVIEAARVYGVEKFCFLGSSCIYPRLAPQPIREEYLLTSCLESSNKSYAIAKIAGVEMISSYRKQYDFPGYSLMPTNLYGIGDSFDLQNSHVLPALIRKFHEGKMNESKSVVVWGTGKARREFMNSRDLARIIVDTLFLDIEVLPDLMNVGVGDDISIAELAAIVKKIVGYKGDVVYDATKPDGTPRKVLDISRMTALEMKAEIGLEEGIRETYKWYVKNKAN